MRMKMIMRKMKWRMIRWRDDDAEKEEDDDVEEANAEKHDEQDR